MIVSLLDQFIDNQVKALKQKTDCEVHVVVFDELCQQCEMIRYIYKGDSYARMAKVVSTDLDQYDYFCEQAEGYQQSDFREATVFMKRVTLPPSGV